MVHAFHGIIVLDASKEHGNEVMAVRLIKLRSNGVDPLTICPNQQDNVIEIIRLTSNVEQAQFADHDIGYVKNMILLLPTACFQHW